MRVQGAVIVALCLCSTTANGQSEPAPASPPPPSPVDRARESFLTATALAREGKWNEALAEFERSAALRPHPVTFFNVGYTERALGRYTRARRALRRALSQVDGDTLPPDLAADARAFLQEVESRVAHVTVAMKERLPLTIDGRPLEVELDPSGVTVLVAGTREPGPPEAPPRAPFLLLVDPGSHVVVVTAEAGKETSSTEHAEPGARNARWTLSSPVRELPPPSREPIAGAPSESASSAPTWAWVAYGAGAAGLVFGSTFGILAMNEEADLEEECGPDKVCEWDQRDAVDTFNTQATLANVGFAVAFVGAAVGTVLLLTHREESPPTPAVTWRARIGPGSLDVIGEF